MQDVADVLACPPASFNKDQFDRILRQLWHAWPAPGPQARREIWRACGAVLNRGVVILVSLTYQLILFMWRCT